MRQFLEYTERKRYETRSYRHIHQDTLHLISLLLPRVFDSGTRSEKYDQRARPSRNAMKGTISLDGGGNGVLIVSSPPLLDRAERDVE